MANILLAVKSVALSKASTSFSSKKKEKQIEISAFLKMKDRKLDYFDYYVQKKACRFLSQVIHSILKKTAPCITQKT